MPNVMYTRRHDQACQFRSEKGTKKINLGVSLVFFSAPFSPARFGSRGCPPGKQTPNSSDRKKFISLFFLPRCFVRLTCIQLSPHENGIKKVLRNITWCNHSSLTPYLTAICRKLLAACTVRQVTPINYQSIR